jgi:transcriptional regulator with XRE-family HTH domain
MTYNECVGLAIRTTRTLKGMTIPQLTEHIGLTQSTISRMETGHIQVNIVHLRKISIALNVSASSILKRAEEYFAESDE